MKYKHIQVHPVAGALGAEVTSVDLSNPLDDETFSEIHSAHIEHLVLFFPQQNLTPDALKTFGRRFGNLNVHPFLPNLKDHPEVLSFFTSHFKSMTPEESRPLLEFLYRHTARPEFTCRYRWAPSAVAFWDNRCTQHYAVNDYYGHRRYMYRVTINGDRPY